MTEYVYDTGPIDRIHGPPPVSTHEGVRRTAAWLIAQEDGGDPDQEDRAA
jgi:hypothetical protein